MIDPRLIAELKVSQSINGHAYRVDVHGPNRKYWERLFLGMLEGGSMSNSEMLYELERMGMPGDVALGFFLTMKSYLFLFGRKVDDDWLDRPSETHTWITQHGRDYLQSLRTIAIETPKQEEESTDWKTRAAND